jgi:hypothetical protein
VTGHTDESDLEALRVELERTADVPDPTEQRSREWSTLPFARSEYAPSSSGASPVAYWTTGLYLTADIDVVMPHATEIEERLAALGFERDGRFWTLPGRVPVLEAPGVDSRAQP